MNERIHLLFYFYKNFIGFTNLYVKNYNKNKVGDSMGCCGSSKKSNREKNIKNLNLSPIGQFKVRLASGEITIDEYLQTKTVLEQ